LAVALQELGDGDVLLGETDSEDEYEEPDYTDAAFDAALTESDEALVARLRQGGELESDDEVAGSDGDADDSSEGEAAALEAAAGGWLVPIDDPVHGKDTEQSRESNLALEFVRQ
jgi:hypothetical protein